MIIAMLRNIAAMNTATATFPFCSSPAKSTSGVNLSITRYERNIRITPSIA